MSNRDTLIYREIDLMNKLQKCGWDPEAKACLSGIVGWKFYAKVGIDDPDGNLDIRVGEVRGVEISALTKLITTVGNFISRDEDYWVLELENGKHGASTKIVFDCQ